MIEVENIRILNIQIQYEDIENFSNIITKLLKETKAAGFKKTFTDEEKEMIERLAESIGVKEDEGASNVLMLQKQ
jgi:hypothetical protein